VNNVDLKGLLDEATANDAPRWMFVRGGLDHGPLSARELIQAIVRNEVTEDDIVFNMDSGERKKLTQWPQYREFAEQARDKRRKDQHTREVKSAIADESVSTRAKSAVAVAIVAVAAIIGVVYYKTLGPGRSLARRQAELDDALAHGQLHLSEGGLQVLPAPPPSAAHRSGGGGGGGGGFGFTSYDNAMNQPIEFNFGGSGPGGGTLNDNEISAPLNASLGRFGSCATAEMARGGTVRQVQMRIAVAGNGQPFGLSVASGSGAFRGCVASVVRSLRWRAFGGPRIGFAWGFSLE
jgi:transposase-like protein